VEIEFYLKKLSELTGASLSVLVKKMNLVADNNIKQTRKILKPTKVARHEFNRRDEQFFLKQIFAIGLKYPHLRTVLNNLYDEYLNDCTTKIKQYLLGQKIEFTPEVADQLSEIEIIADQMKNADDERVLLLGFLRDIENIKLQDEFENLSRALVLAIDSEKSDEEKNLNLAVNELKKDLNLIKKTSARDDFAGLFKLWEKRKNAN
jgi:hypothetical protein